MCYLHRFCKVYLSLILVDLELPSFFCEIATITWLRQWQVLQITGTKSFLDRNEVEIERQRLIDDLFADIGSVPDFEGFPASERVKSSNSEDDSASEADRVA